MKTYIFLSPRFTNTSECQENVSGPDQLVSLPSFHPTPRTTTISYRNLMGHAQVGAVAVIMDTETDQARIQGKLESNIWEMVLIYQGYYMKL